MTVVWLLVALSASSSSAGYAPAPRGIPNSQVEIYDASSLSCDDGRALPIEHVNDDYCDCVDGADEPGTAACAGTESSKGFYCINIGHRGKYIPSSFTDDSVCDCCDGSDEAADACANTCEAAAATARAAHAARIARLEEGARLKAEYVERGKAEASARAGRIAELEGALGDIAKKREALEAEEARLSEQQKALRNAKQWEADGRVLERFPGLIDMGLEELRSLLVRYARRVDTKGRELMNLVTGSGGDDEETWRHDDDEYDHHHYDDADMMDDYGDYGGEDPFDEYHDDYGSGSDFHDDEYPEGDGGLDDTYDDEGLDDDEIQSMADEYGSDGYEDSAYATENEMAMENESGDAAIDDSPAPNEGAEVEMAFDETDDDDAMSSGPGGDIHGGGGGSDVEDGVDANVDEKQKVEDSPQEEEEDLLAGEEVTVEDAEDLVAKRAALEEVRAEVRKLERDKRSAQDDENQDFGVDQEFFVLKGKCFSAKHQKFSYEICPFGEAHQREGSATRGGTRLGSWAGLIDVEGNQVDGVPDKAFKFENGDYCWNGPARSAVISLRCGTENELQDIDEPRTCEYTMVLSTPAACSLSFDFKPINFDGFDDVSVEVESQPEAL